MSITDDIKSYADKTVTESRKVLDSTLSTAQAQLNDLNGNVQSIADKATDVAGDLRTQAEKAINVDAIRAAVEPYLSQAKGYSAQLQERAEDVLADLRKDPRLAKAFELSDVVLTQVNERVVKPVQSFTGTKAGSPASRTRTTKPSPTGARKPATTKPASKPAAKTTAKSTTRPAAKKATARKTATKRTSS